MRSNKIFLMLIVSVMPLVYGADQPPHEAPVPPAAPIASLRDLALRALVPRPDKIALQYDEIYSSDAPEHPFESGVFIESVDNALNKRLGIGMLALIPDMPIKSRVLGNGGFMGFSPDGTIMALGLLEGAHGRSDIYLRNTATGELVKKVKGEFFEAFSPDGKLFVSTSVSAVTGSDVVRLWNIATGELVAALEGRFGAFSPDSEIIALTAFDNIGTLLEMRLWNTASGKLIKKIEGERFGAFSPDGKLFATSVTAIDWSAIHMRNTATGELIKKFEREYFQAFSPDGKIIVSGVWNDAGTFRETRLLNATTGDLIKKIEREEFEAFSPDGEKIVSGRDSMSVWSIATGKLLHVFEREAFPQFSPDSKLLASVEDRELRNRVRLRNASTGDVIRTFEDEYLPRFSPDGIILATTARIEDHYKSFASEVDFRPDLANIIDFDLRVFLIKAAQDWREGRPHRVDADDPLYNSVIEQIPYLNNPLLFDLGTAGSSSSDGSVIVGSSSGDNEEIQAPDGRRTFIDRIMRWFGDVALGRQQENK